MKAWVFLSHRNLITYHPYILNQMLVCESIIPSFTRLYFHLCIITRTNAISWNVIIYHCHITNTCLNKVIFCQYFPPDLFETISLVVIIRVINRGWCHNRLITAWGSYCYAIEDVHNCWLLFGWTHEIWPQNLKFLRRQLWSRLQMVTHCLLLLRNNAFE